MTTPTPELARPRPAWDTTVPPRRGQPTLVTLGLLLAAPGVVLTALRVLRPRDDAAALVAAFVPYGIPLLAAALLLLVLALLRARRRPPLAVLAAVTGALLAAQVAWQLPYFVPDHRPVATDTFTLLTLNTYRGRADPDAVRAAAERADVVVLEETSPPFLAALDDAAWRRRLPHDLGGIAVGGGTVVFSRFPLSGSRPLSPGFEQWATTVEVPGTGPVVLVASHPCNPFCGGGRWATEHDALVQVVRSELDRPVVVAGDLNAVVDHASMQQLHGLGLRSAADLVGTGWAPTYPADRTLLPPLLAIDHVLVSPTLSVASLERVRVAGTDHLGLLARIGVTG